MLQKKWETGSIENYNIALVEGELIARLAVGQVATILKKHLNRC